VSIQKQRESCGNQHDPHGERDESESLDFSRNGPVYTPAGGRGAGRARQLCELFHSCGECAPASVYAKSAAGAILRRHRAGGRWRDGYV
jgi:hypothetical protein